MSGHSEEAWLIYIAALSSNLGLPADVDVLTKGARRITDTITVGQVCDEIIADFDSGALDERLNGN